MRHRFGWAIGWILLVAHAAVGQGPPQPVSPATGSLPFSLVGGKKEEPLSEGPLVEFEIPGRPLMYVSADYLMWWVHRGPTPALLTTGPNSGGGVLGQPGTIALFTSTQLDYHNISGMRFGAGVNLCPDRFWGLELGGFVLDQKTIDFARVGNGDGTPLLAIPFINAGNNGQQSSLLVNSQTSGGAPDRDGRIHIHSEIDLWGYDVNLVAHSINTAERSFDLLVGFRSVTLDEDLTINQNLTARQTGAITIQSPTVGQGQPNYFNVPVGGNVAIFDAFSARNRFYGAQVGGRFGWDFGRLKADLTGKIAFGVTDQQATIDGQTTAAAVTRLLPPTPFTATTPGGVFAQQNNIGTFSQTQFTVIPEVNFDLNYAITNWLSFRCGYSALYWSNVARPGSQIDPVLNAKLIPTGPLQNTTVAGFPTGAFIPGQEQGRPYFNFRDTSFWAHGINFGLEFRY